MNISFEGFDFDFVWDLGCPSCGSLEWNGTEACCLMCSLYAYRELFR